MPDSYAISPDKRLSFTYEVGWPVLRRGDDQLVSWVTARVDAVVALIEGGHADAIAQGRRYRGFEVVFSSPLDRAGHQKGLDRYAAAVESWLGQPVRIEWLSNADALEAGLARLKDVIGRELVGIAERVGAMVSLIVWDVGDDRRVEMFEMNQDAEVVGPIREWSDGLTSLLLTLKSAEYDTHGSTWNSVMVLAEPSTGSHRVVINNFGDDFPVDQFSADDWRLEHQRFPAARG